MVPRRLQWSWCLRPPSPRPSPPGRGRAIHIAGQFFDPCCSHRFCVIGRETQDNQACHMVQNAANHSPSPGGEGRGEGGRSLISWPDMKSPVLISRHPMNKSGSNFLCSFRCFAIKTIRDERNCTAITAAARSQPVRVGAGVICQECCAELRTVRPRVEPRRGQLCF